jgi:hypothetical protein
MRVRTDDEVYRVDAVWLGPPRATFPWRARYVSWGIGVVSLLLILAIQRQLGIGFNIFGTAWSILGAVLLAKVIGSRINHERPLSSVATMWLRELQSPRERISGVGGAASAARVRINSQRPRKADIKHRKEAKRLVATTGSQRRGRSHPRKKEVRGVRTKTKK